jgi:Gluconate 2-dehydrogenase subunit 3
MMDRRTTIKWVLAAGAASQLPAFAVTPTSPVGYGKDPNVTKQYTPGELWPLTLTDAQTRATKALCDVIIPADAQWPAASALAVHKFIDEWISAPYPECQSDREIIVRGLTWLDAESRRRHSTDFAALSADQANSICDDIPNNADAAKFFDRFRNLTALGYYTTPIGMKDIGYVGNEPLPTFDGPPLEVLKRVGLA